jgi:hypothetical protein
LDFKCTLIPAGLALLSCGAMGQAVKSAKGYDFHSIYTSGKPLTFKVVMAIYPYASAPERNVGVFMTQSFNPLSVKNGLATLKATVDNVHTKDSRLPIVIKPRQFVVDRRNKLIGSTQGSLAIVAFPDHPIKIGQSWSALTSVSTDPSTTLVDQATYRLDGVQTSHGKTIFTFNVTFKGIATGEGAVLVDAADCSVISFVSQLELHTSKGDHEVKMIFKRA